MAEIDPPADTDVVAFDKSYVEDDNHGEVELVSRLPAFIFV